jgi:malonate-semialdehyde dehydrogenase (acetylating)/methylmalonate-semialdehyde dehydrogenase
MEVWRDEVFGPVLAMVHAGVARRRHRRGQLQRLRQRRLDLHRVGRRGRRFRHDVEVGMIGVNVGVAAPGRVLPVLGLEGLLPRRPARPRADAVEFYTRKKTVTSRWFSGGETGRYFVES